MTSNSESAVEKVPRWDVGPTEDVVQALIESLVDPLLPLRVTSVPPSQDIQIAVAKQMHAVVLLYNYHHRKQKPELVFLEFMNFCKLAIVIRPPLISFMKMMKESKPEELSSSEDCLSLTEKAIRDACDIALALDASREVPNVEGWPISKLAVLLIDSKKENCVLQFGAISGGSWSLIEKELNESTSITPKTSDGEKLCNKRKLDNQNVSTYNLEFLQLGYDTIKDVTGINSSELEVLETHMTYSVSKEKSATCFYIMQWRGSLNEPKQVPLKFILESLESLDGPLAKKLDHGLWRATPGVKFHHTLPYAELILCWLSGYGVNSSGKKTSDYYYSNNNCGDSSHGQVASPDDNFQRTVKESILGNKFVKRFNTLDFAESIQNRILENVVNGSKQPDSGLSSSSSQDLYDRVLSFDCTMKELDKEWHLADGATDVAGRTTHDNPEKKLRVYHHKRKKKLAMKQLQVTVPDLRVEVDSLNSNHTQRSDEKVSEGEDYLTTPCNGTGTTSTGNLQAQLEAETKHHEVQNISDTSRLNYMRNGDETVSNDKGDCIQMEVDLLKSNHAEKVSGDEGCLTNTCNKTGSAATGHQQAQVEVNFKHNLGPKTMLVSDQLQAEAKFKQTLGAQTISASDQVQNALALLYPKRQELYSQICNMEDALALCEANVCRIRDGGEIDLARQCIKGIISGNLNSLLENGTRVKENNNQKNENCRSQYGKQTRLSEAYLPGMSSCQDLEYTCLRNDWRLPRYLLESSDGKFMSNVVVEGKDFKLHAKGGFESKPCVAREAAAAEMIAVMRTTFHSPQP